MAKIRTIKPALARHRTLFEMEQESGLPMRFIWAMFPSICDREGRFVWRPWELKLDICPYDQIDFEKAMDLLHQNGMLHKYKVDAETYGTIPTFSKHQHVNVRETKSVLPSPEDGQVVDAPSPTCMHVKDTCANDEEGKGREVEGKWKGREVEPVHVTHPKTPDLAVQAWQKLLGVYCEGWKARYNSPRSPSVGPKEFSILKKLIKEQGGDRARVLVEAYLQMPDSWFVTKAHDLPTMIGNLNKVSLFADSGKMVSKQELRELDSKVDQHNLLAALDRGEI